MIHYSNGFCGLGLLCQFRGSVFPKALVWAVPAVAISWFLDDLYSSSDSFLPDWEFGTNAGALWSSFNFVVGFLVVFRTQAAYSRYWEGASLVQQARANLFNACSSLIAFSSADKAKRHKVEEFQHLLVRLMSMMHCVGLQTVADMEDVKFQFFNTDGMDRACLRFLSLNTDKQQRCEIVIQWIQRLVVEASRNSIIDVPPPILTRFFQELSQGATHIINARIMTGIPFPFPYAQMLTTLLIFHWLLTPFLCVAIMQSKVWACLFTFITVFSLWGVNFIAAEIESPFGNDINDLPIHGLQKDMNKSLWILLHPNTQAVPRFNFDPIKHRKWDVVCQHNFTRTGMENRSIFRPMQSGMWTQRYSIDSSMSPESIVNELPSGTAVSAQTSNYRKSFASGQRSIFTMFTSATKSGLLVRTRTFESSARLSASRNYTDAGESELPACATQSEPPAKTTYASIGFASVEAVGSDGSCISERTSQRLGSMIVPDTLENTASARNSEDSQSRKEIIPDLQEVPDEFHPEYNRVVLVTAGDREVAHDNSHLLKAPQHSGI